MKKISVISIFILLCICTITAVPGGWSGGGSGGGSSSTSTTRQNPNKLLIVAYDGVSGIPVGANYFHAAAGASYYGDKSKTDESSSYYNDTQMIGLIQFLYVSTTNNKTSPVKMNGTITVTITCPNGFYLTSQSNPNYKRPFEILIAPAGANSILITEDQPTQSWTVNSEPSVGHYHCDVVLSLPGTTKNDTKECVVTSSTGKTTSYPLANLSDYSAVVTFDVKYEYKDSDNNTQVLEKTLTIPFSGYYDGTTSPSPNTSGDGVSMNIILNSEAYNIDIENKRGVWIPVGEFYFNMMLGQVTTTNRKAAIFFSSSEDPYDTSAQLFTMVHDDVKATTPLTTQNSINFTLRTVSLENSSDIKTFDGTTYFPKSASSVTSDFLKNLINPTTVITDKMYDGYSDNKSLRSYYRYSGRIEIMLDNNDITMLQGRYTETIYVHVMVYV